MSPAPVASWLLMFIFFAVMGILFAGLVAIGWRSGRARRRAIPREELAALVQAREVAEQLAAAGDAPGGQGALTAGLARADRFLRTGEPWARDLKDQWQAAVEEFVQDHRVEPRPELVPATAPEATGREVTPLPSDRGSAPGA